LNNLFIVGREGRLMPTFFWLCVNEVAEPNKVSKNQPKVLGFDVVNQSVSAF